MYTQRELTAIAAGKATLRRRIFQQRIQCARAAARVVQPLAWLDRAVTHWRRLSPLVKFAAVPLGLLLKRSPAPRLRGLGRMLRWGPFVLGALRGLTGPGRR